MLKHLKLTNVGPASSMELDLAPRLNLLTGDNGLGKSFLLDIAWWALTRKWPAEVNPKLTSGLKALPTGDGKATIGFSFSGKAAQEDYESTFDRRAQAWTGRPGRPSNPGLVLYAQVDGSFSVWDPARNYWRTKGQVDIQERHPAYIFGPRQVWNGLPGSEGRTLCNGLLVDWAGWQKENGEVFASLCAVLRVLSPSEGEDMVPGTLIRISLDDVRDMPTLRMPYGQEVAVLHASAGVKRIVALSYLLVWAWEEHKKASVLLGQATTKQVIIFIDEIEAHLHPRWQRQVIRSLLEAIRLLTSSAEVQVVTATHSPLVLASVEPLFDREQDAWFDLDLVSGKGHARVELSRRPFVRRGDASNWLVSDAFDLGSARSLEAEKALEEAAHALSDEAFDVEQARSLDARLRQVLGDTDPVWMNWRFVGERRGWIS